MPNWAVLGVFGLFWAVLENVTLTTASTLPEACLYSIARQMQYSSTELRARRIPNLKKRFPKGPIFAQMGPNGPNGLRPHFLHPHQSALSPEALNAQTRAGPKF